jgi:hypothetical protein
MTPEKIQALRESAPSVWGQANHFGFDDGWFEIVRDLGLELEKLGATSSGGKEKYATLDIFISSPDPPYGTPSIQAAVKRAVEKSQVTCEVCGKRGRLVVNESQWESTACRKHQGNSKPCGVEENGIHRETAREVVDAVLNTLWERRPFKHDLGKMRYEGASEADKEKGRGGPIWEEMMTVMEDAVQGVLGKPEYEDDDDSTEVTVPSSPMAFKKL